MKCSLIIYCNLALWTSVNSGYSSGSFETRWLPKTKTKNKSWFIHRAPPPAWLKTKPQMTHWFPQTNQIARSGTLQCDSEETSSLSSYIVVHLTTPFFNIDSVTITCVKWALRPASGASALAGLDTCLRSAVPATLDRMWLINRPVLITGTPLTGVAVTWIPCWGDSKLQGKCNGFCYIATHWDSELHHGPDVITCPQDAGSVFYDDYSENQVSAQIVMVFASIAPVLSIMSIQRGNKGMQQVVHFRYQPVLSTSVKSLTYKHTWKCSLGYCLYEVTTSHLIQWLIRPGVRWDPAVRLRRSGTWGKPQTTEPVLTLMLNHNSIQKGNILWWNILTSVKSRPVNSE